ncbi:MAG: hypothetical protein WBD37_01685 [Anderseniella sp.]
MNEQADKLATFNAQARKIFLLALPFAVLFWAFGINFGGAEEGGAAWINAPMLIAASAFVGWIAGELLLLFRKAK